MDAVDDALPASAEGSDGNGSRMTRPRVIIVEDDRDTREMLTLALEQSGFEVTEAANGLRLISSLHVDRPDVILLDVMMSWMDGFELCQAIKKNEEFRDIPVVFLSARADAEDRERGRAVGAADYFAKPVNVALLASRLRELAGAQRTSIESPR